MKNALVLALFVLLCTLPPLLFSETNKTLPKTSPSRKPRDATQEINQLAQQPKPKDETALVVLSNFANMIGNFANIVQDPDNSNNVGSNLANMFQGVINIAMEAFKSGGPSRNLTEQQVETIKEQMQTFFNQLLDDKEFKAMLELFISMKAQEMKQ